MERAIVGLLAFLFLFAAEGRDPLTKEQAAQIIDQFQYEGNYQIDSEKAHDGYFESCWEYERTFITEYPNMDEPLDVTMTLYIPNRGSLATEMVPAVVMIPPIGGVNFLDTQTARTLCDSNMAAIVITNDFANVEYQANQELLPPEDHQKTYYRIAAAIKGAMVMIDDDPNLDYQRIGLFGVSLGGILSSFVMATQPDIAAGYFIVAGGDVPEILAHSQQEEVSAIRRKRMKEQNFATKAEYEAYLRQYLTLDPIDISMTMVPETLNMVIAKKDKNVPSTNQYLLHKAFGEPEASYNNAGHLDTILSALLWGNSRQKVARFFKKRFKESNPRPAAFRWLNQFDLAYYY